MKLSYFHDEWKDRPEWITTAEQTVDHVWKTCYRGYSVAHRLPAVNPVGEDATPEGENLSRWERKRLAATQLPENVDMMARFQQQHEVHRVKDVVRYWFERSQDSQWRDLARMALTYLTLPAMSAEPERVFSGAKITLSDRRCRMGDDAVEAVECLKSWQRDGLIAATRDDIMAIEEMLNALCEEDLL